MQKLQHLKTFVKIGSKGNFRLSTNAHDDSDFIFGYINCNVGFDAQYEANLDGELIMPTGSNLLFEGYKETESGFENTYGVSSNDAEITEKVEFISGVNAIRQHTAVKNRGNEPFTLNKLSAANVIGIGYEGSKWFESDRFKVYYALNRMQGEGQWKCKSLKDLDLYPASHHPWEECVFRLNSLSTWSTSNYYPIFIIEDTEQNECWFFEREGGEAWYMEITAYGGYTGQFINVALGGGDEKLLWNKELQPGETYETTTAVYGVIKGGFEDAVKELTKYKRLASKVPQDITPAYNDYMNALWAKQTYPRIISLIDAASELGIKRYVTDDGWQKELGVWIPSEERLGGKLEDIIKYANSKGMQFGVWFEFETASYKDAEEAKQKGVDDYLLTRYGKIISPHRPKLNMRSEYATNLLFERVKNLYDMGVRYIKNDHNNEDRLGISIYNNESPSEGTRLNALAYTNFMLKLQKAFPDLIIEACSGGGHRLDAGTLQYHPLQSATDQEDYRLVPSIICGLTALIQPEKILSWSYTYPQTFDKHYFDLCLDEDDLIEFSDGRQTAFNMVNSMLVSIYQSGAIDYFNELNKSLVKEALKVYSSYSSTISKRYPVYPCGLKNLDKTDYLSLGLQGENDLILAVWALETTEFKIDLTKFGYSSAELLYPTLIDNFSYFYVDGTLKVKAKDKYTAFLLKLN